MKQRFVLQPSPHPARRNAVKAVQDAPDGYFVSISEPTRSLAENSILHVLVAQIAGEVPWAGAKRDPETWKRLLVAAWCRVHGHSVEVLPALDGHGVDIVPARTSKLSKRECADLIEFIYAWGADQGLNWAAKESVDA